MLYSLALEVCISDSDYSTYFRILLWYPRLTEYVYAPFFLIVSKLPRASLFSASVQAVFQEKQNMWLDIPGITRSCPVPSFLWSLVENLFRRVRALFCRNTEQIQEAKSHLCGQKLLSVNPEEAGSVTNCCHLLLVHFQSLKLQQTKFSTASRNCRSSLSLGEKGKNNLLYLSQE